MGKFFQGRKRHYVVDMKSGLIDRVAAKLAEATDAAGFGCVCPNGDRVFAD